MPHADTDFMDRAPDKTALGIMRPASCMYDLGAAHMVVCRIAVTLEYALEVAQKPFGTFPFPTEAESKTTGPPGRLYGHR